MALKPIVRALIVPVLGLSLSGQHDLFDDEHPCGTEEETEKESRKLRRNTHPATSKEAARLIAPKLNHLHLMVLALVKANDGMTASELAILGTHRDTRHVGRRLPELVTLGKLRRGEVRKCTVTGRNATTWCVP